MGHLGYKNLCSISMCSGGSYGSLICSRLVISLDSCASAIHQQQVVLKHVSAESLSLVIPYLRIKASLSDAWSADAPIIMLSPKYIPLLGVVPMRVAERVCNIKYPKQFQF